MANTPKDSIATRKIAVLIADGVNANSLNKMKKALEDAGAKQKQLHHILEKLNQIQDKILSQTEVY
ncbi:MAG: hypothetical protein IPL24_11655 [Bacteroidetes bacterium]|nr:hypothetical protein [Bacteroidota bacterium]